MDIQEFVAFHRSALERDAVRHPVLIFLLKRALEEDLPKKRSYGCFATATSFCSESGRQEIDAGFPNPAPMHLKQSEGLICIRPWMRH